MPGLTLGAFAMLLASAEGLSVLAASKSAVVFLVALYSVSRACRCSESSARALGKRVRGRMPDVGCGQLSVIAAGACCFTAGKQLDF